MMAAALGHVFFVRKNVEDLPQPTLAGFEAGSPGAFIDPPARTFTTLATANHASGLVVHHWPGARPLKNQRKVRH